MTRHFAKLAIVALVGGVLSSSPAVAQLLPPTKQAEHVKIIKGPALEIALDSLAIVRWTSTNPGGDDDHFAIAHFGTDPSDLSQTAKSHIRLNRTHPETIFRVRISGLKPQTTYYYWVTSMGADGRSDGVKSLVNQFTTPASGQRIVANP
jgi:Purple acid Phosphatase, N-terminal domain